MPLDLVPFQIVASPQSPWTRCWRSLWSSNRKLPLLYDGQGCVDVSDGVLAANLGVVDPPVAASVLLFLFKRLQHVSIWIFETKLLISSFSKASLPNSDTVQQLGKCLQRFHSYSRNSQCLAISFRTSSNPENSFKTSEIPRNHSKSFS